MERKEMKRIRMNRYETINDAAIELETTRNNLYLIEKGKRNGSFNFWINFQKVYKVDDNDMWRIMKGEK